MPDEYPGSETHFGGYKRVQITAASGIEEKSRPHMTSHEFINTVRKLHCLDYCAVNFLTRAEWQRFRKDPTGFMMRCGDGTLAKIWEAVEADGKPVGLGDANPFADNGDMEPAEVGLK